MKQLISILFLVLLVSSRSFEQQFPSSITLSSPPPAGVRAIAASTVGNPGAATYYYWVVANFPIGKADANSNAVVTNAPNALSAMNFVLISWTPVNGALSYDVIRSTTSMFPGSNCTSCALVLGTTATSFNDVGTAGLAYTYVSAPNATASITLDNTNFSLPRLLINPASSSPTTLPIVSILEFGAQADGITNDFPAINNAMAAACAMSTSSSTILFPSGVIRVSSSIIPPCSLMFSGQGVGSDTFGGTRLQFDAGVSGFLFSSVGARFSIIQDIRLMSQSSVLGTDDGINCSNTNDVIMDNIIINGFGRNGLRLDTTGGGSCVNWRSRNLRISQSRSDGMYIIGVRSINSVHYNYLAELNLGRGAFITTPGSQNHVFYHWSSQNNVQGGFFTNATSITFRDIYSSADNVPQPPVFTGSGLNDMTVDPLGLYTNNSYTAAADINYCIKVAANGTPDTFVWSINGGATYPNGPTNMSTSDVLLSNGVNIRWGATVGHTINDFWCTQANPAFMIAGNTVRVEGELIGWPTFGNTGGGTNSFVQSGNSLGTQLLSGNLNGGGVGSITSMNGIVSTSIVTVGSNLVFAGNGFILPLSDGLWRLSNSANSVAAAIYRGYSTLNKTANYLVPFGESDATYTNLGAVGAITFTLPTPVVGMRYTFSISTAQNLIIQAAGGAVIRNGATVSAANGTATANTIGNVITLQAMSTGEWRAIDTPVGTWAIV